MIPNAVGIKRAHWTLSGTSWPDWDFCSPSFFSKKTTNNTPDISRDPQKRKTRNSLVPRTDLSKESQDLGSSLTENPGEGTPTGHTQKNEVPSNQAPKSLSAAPSEHGQKSLSAAPSEHGQLDDPKCLSTLHLNGTIPAKLYGASVLLLSSMGNPVHQSATLPLQMNGTTPAPMWLISPGLQKALSCPLRP